LFLETRRVFLGTVRQKSYARLQYYEQPTLEETALKKDLRVHKELVTSEELNQKDVEDLDLDDRTLPSTQWVKKWIKESRGGSWGTLFVGHVSSAGGYNKDACSVYDRHYFTGFKGKDSGSRYLYNDDGF